MKKPIGLRIKEIFSSEKIIANPSILNLNFTQFESLFPEEELKHNDFNISTISDKFTDIDFTNNLKTIDEKKFDLIFCQLPIGLKGKFNENDAILELIDKNLIDNGFLLNLSTTANFSVKLEKHFPKFTRYRENFIGEIYKPETSINISLYEIIKGPMNDLWDSGIKSCNFQDYRSTDKDLSNLKVIETPKAYFYSAQISSSQERQKEIFKSKNLIPKYIRDITLGIKSIDLLKSNKKRDEVIKQIENVRNSVFVPMIPSKSNTVEISTKSLKPSRYWLLMFNPEDFLPDYVQSFLNSDDGKEQLLSLSGGSIIPHLNMEALGRICIPMKNTIKQKQTIKNRQTIAEAYKIFNEYIGKLSDQVETEEFTFRPEEFMKQFPDYTIRNLLSLEESKNFERKSTLKFDLKQNKVMDHITDTILKTIVAFLNTDGGTLIVGQADDKTLIGIEKDKFKNEDDASRFLKDKIKSKIGIKYLETFINYKFHIYEEKTILIINCIKLPGEDRAFLNEDEFYIRSGPSNSKLSMKEAIEFIELKSKKIN
ncbi:putative DNA binding domain-containing protein [Candidatus Pelagibacter sp.]|nr:putative DNA binding domain-containing protein [Candidatus Pelagibacter sp.]